MFHYRHFRSLRLPLALFLLAMFGCDASYSGEGCFVAGTPVETIHGALPIERLKVGDLVYAWDFEREERIIAPVDVVVRRTANLIVAMEIGDHKVRVTPDHPLYDTEATSWRVAGEWKSGQHLGKLGQGGALLPVSLGQVVQIQEPKEIEVYNIKVRHFENAFVGGVLARFYE